MEHPSLPGDSRVAPADSAVLVCEELMLQGIAHDCPEPLPVLTEPLCEVDFLYLYRTELFSSKAGCLLI